MDNQKKKIPARIKTKVHALYVSMAVIVFSGFIMFGVPHYVPRNYIAIPFFVGLGLFILAVIMIVSGLKNIKRA